MTLKIFGYFDDWMEWFMALPLWIQIISGIVVFFIFMYFWTWFRRGD